MIEQEENCVDDSRMIDIYNLAIILCTFIIAQSVKQLQETLTGSFSKLHVY